VLAAHLLVDSHTAKWSHMAISGQEGSHANGAIGDPALPAVVVVVAGGGAVVVVVVVVVTGADVVVVGGGGGLVVGGT